MKRASWLIALKQRNYLSIWSRPGLTKDKITENNTRQLWLVALWKKERSFYFVEHFLVLFLPRIVLPGWLHAGQLHGGHRDHGEGVRSCLHSREKHHREIPPTTLWAGSAFFPFFVSSHNNFRFGPRMTMRFSREWWSRRTLICKWKHWSCYNKGTNPWQIPNE